MAVQINQINASFGHAVRPAEDQLDHLFSATSALKKKWLNWFPGLSWIKQVFSELNDVFNLGFVINLS